MLICYQIKGTMAIKIPRLGSSSRNRKTVAESFNDLGFGTKYTSEGQRLINKDGSFNVKRTGLKHWTPYQDMVEMSWTNFSLLIICIFCLVNSFFAILYVIIGIDSLSGVMPKNLLEDFANAFFFSVQTFTTVGYGSISPQGIFVNIVASIDALVGLMSFALATGLFFARFSKPKAQIIFSDYAIIAPYKEMTGFEFRIANLRNNRLINLKATLIMSWLENDKGEKKRRFFPLKLERNTVTLLPLNWTIVHPIEADSPFFQNTAEDLIRREAEVLIMIEAYDETYAQTVNVNRSYTAKEMIWNVKFDPMYHYDDEEGITILQLDQINKVHEDLGMQNIINKNSGNNCL